MIMKMLINGHAQHLLCAGHVASVCMTTALSPCSFLGLVFSFFSFPTLGSRGSEEPGDLAAARWAAPGITLRAAVPKLLLLCGTPLSELPCAKPHPCSSSPSTPSFSSGCGRWVADRCARPDTPPGPSSPLDGPLLCCTGKYFLSGAMCTASLGPKVTPRK